MNILGVLLVVQCAFQFAVSLTLPETGNGYENLLIAINGKYKPADEAAFIEKLKSYITAASKRLFEANSLYLKSVKILVPNTWSFNANTLAVDESFVNANVRVFPFDNTGYIAPFTHRSKYCGAQGEYIYLSPEYIDTFETQTKADFAFVHEFAIYRYGLFEEYGRGRDGTRSETRYPYIDTQNQTQLSSWKVTGCSDAPIPGKFVFYDPDPVTGTPLEYQCTKGDVDYGTCKFIADTTGQTAKTSLLHAPYISTVSQFCDSHSHDKASRNRHNYFCGERSAWEVMKMHPDFQNWQNSTVTPPDPIFTTVKPAFGVPAIYFLIDTSSGNDATTVFSSIKTKLINWVSNTAPRATLVGLGEFGGTENLAVNNLPFGYIVNKLSPAPASNIGSQFTSLVNQLSQSRPAGIEIDRAVGDAAVLLTSRSWQEGSIIVLVKLTKDDVVASVPEGPIIDLLTSRKARLFSIEYEVTESTSTLRKVASKSSGRSYYGGSTDFNGKFDTLLDELAAIATSGSLEKVLKIEIGEESFELQPGASHNSVFQTHVSASTEVGFDFYATAGGTIAATVTPNSSPITVPKITGTSWNLNQWDLYSYVTQDTATLTKRAAWCYRVTNLGSSPVKVFAMAYHNRTKIPPGLGDPTDSKGDIHELELWTSDVGGEMTLGYSPYRPFGIYAYFFNGLRAIRGLNVYAIVRDPTGKDTRIKLYDNKPSNGADSYDIDLEDNDGVYSSIFNPTTPGYHHITIEASSPRTPTCSIPTIARSRQSGTTDLEGFEMQQERVLLPDQNDLYPPFLFVGASGAFFQRRFPYFKSVNAKFSTYFPVPPRVVSVRAAPTDQESHVKLTFFEPHMYEGAKTPERYVIRYSTSRSALIRADGGIAIGTSVPEVTADSIVLGDLNHVSSASAKEVVFKVSAGEEGPLPMYFVIAGVATSNETPRYGPPSPIVHAVVKPILITTAAPVTTTTQSTTTISQTTTTPVTTTSTTAGTTTTTVTQTTTRRTPPTIGTVPTNPTEEPEPGASTMISPSYFAFVTVLVLIFA